jgi:hypothetical protein
MDIFKMSIYSDDEEYKTEIEILQDKVDHLLYKLQKYKISVCKSCLNITRVEYFNSIPGVYCRGCKKLICYKCNEFYGKYKHFERYCSVDCVKKNFYGDTVYDRGYSATKEEIAAFNKLISEK